MEDKFIKELHYNLDHRDEFFYYQQQEMDAMEQIILKELEQFFDFENLTNLGVSDELDKLDFNLYEPCLMGLPDSCYHNMSREMEQNVYELIRDNFHNSRHYSLREHIAKAYANTLEDITKDALYEFQRQMSVDATQKPTMGM